jgi:predicted transcriptional regulator
MYFQESEAIASDNPDLLGVVEQVDLQLATIFASAPLRAEDLSSFIGCDPNQVVSVFEMLAGRGVLVSEAMVECEQCENLMSAGAFRQAIDDEDGFDCSSCGRPFRSRTQPLIVYRMTPELLARPKPEVLGIDSGAALAALAHVDHVFQCWGQRWVVKFQGETRIMDDVRGMFYIARLLVEPNRDVLAVSLLAAAAGIDPRVATGTSGQLLTAETHAEYKKKYDEAQEELDDAQQCNDLNRIERAQRDLDALGTEIARATGLGGRKREKTDADKVRKSVSMAVSRAIESIGKEHESLGRHLTTAISSGIFFRYAPDREIVWLT